MSEITQAQEWFSYLDSTNERVFIKCDYCLDSEEENHSTFFINKNCCEKCLIRMSGFSVKNFEKEKQKILTNRYK